MKKDCQLIATLPNLYNEKEIDKLLTCPLIYGARLNSGINNLMEPKQIADKLKVIKEKYHKRIWIDLKGRQLRVIAWANPLYEAIELNHEIEIEYPAKIVFRGSSTANILHTKKNKIILDRPPERAVGKGQSVNIIAKSLNIKGYLTKQDEELIKESKSVGLNDYMASFTESIDDIMDIKRLNSKAIIIPKIESKKGLDFATKYGQYFNLMAARDDLYSEIGNNIHMLKYLKAIIEKDKIKFNGAREVLEKYKEE